MYQHWVISTAVIIRSQLQERTAHFCRLFIFNPIFILKCRCCWHFQAVLFVCMRPAVSASSIMDKWMLCRLRKSVWMYTVSCSSLVGRRRLRHNHFRHDKRLCEADHTQFLHERTQHFQILAKSNQITRWTGRKSCHPSSRGSPALAFPTFAIWHSCWATFQHLPTPLTNCFLLAEMQTKSHECHHVRAGEMNILNTIQFCHLNANDFMFIISYLWLKLTILFPQAFTLHKSN